MATFHNPLLVDHVAQTIKQFVTLQNAKRPFTVDEVKEIDDWCVENCTLTHYTFWTEKKITLKHGDEQLDGVQVTFPIFGFTSNHDAKLFNRRWADYE